MLFKCRCLILMSISALLASAGGWAQNDEISFIHIGDPQFGYSLDTKRGVSERMEKLVDAIAIASPDFVIIPGDFVEDRTIAQTWAFRRSIEDIEQPIVVVPGNHDIENVSEMRNYRRRYGEDYFVRQFDWLWVVGINSEVMRSPSLSSEQYQIQWQWLEKQVEAYLDSEGEVMIWVLHRPPFKNTLDEEESDVNWPPQERIRLLELARKAEVPFILAGHTHTTELIAAIDYDLNIYTVGGAARVFDDQGTGYRSFRMTPSSYEQDYVQVAIPPNTSTGWMGYRQWTPRIWDFSFRHWAWTLVFGLAGAYMIAFSLDRQTKKARGWRRLLMILGAWHLFFAINMQMDFDELTTELLRVLITDQFMDNYRHFLSPLIVGSIAALAAGILLWFCRIKAMWKIVVMALFAFPSLAWFGLQVMSNHFFGIIWQESVWDILFLCGLIGIAAILFFERDLRAGLASSEV